MLLERRTRDGIIDGSITVVIRRWRRPLAVAGRRYRTTAGLLLVEAVKAGTAADITARDARAAGYGSVAEAVADLRGEPGFPVYRLRVRLADEADPRDVLASTAILSTADRAEIDRRLERLDRASSAGPWTAVTLAVIADNPAVRAADLAAGLGRDTLPFKTDVRKLKNLGLTISLDVGYCLSPRGAAYLGRPLPTVDADPATPPRRPGRDSPQRRMVPKPAPR
jgi:hypothetical protein